MKSNGFILALLAAILLAWLLPQGPQLLPLKQITDIGIGFIFLFYGLKLSPSQFRLGFLNYKVHIVVQLTTFLLFPFIVFLFLLSFLGGRSILRPGGLCCGERKARSGRKGQ